MALENVVEVHDGKAVGAFASQAKNVAYGNQSVEDALDGLTANIFGASYSISAYSSANNMFTCPSDGYMRLRAEGSVGNTVTLYNANQEVLSRAVVAVNNRDQWNTVYVKKGMQLYVTITTSNYSDVVYMPLS